MRRTWRSGPSTSCRPSCCRERTGEVLAGNSGGDVNIEGHSAVITGGGSGMGAATARRLAGAGAKVAVLDRDEASAVAVGAEIGGIALVCDVLGCRRRGRRNRPRPRRPRSRAHLRELRRHRSRATHRRSGRTGAPRGIPEGRRGQSHRHLQRHADLRGGHGRPRPGERDRRARGHDRHRLGRSIRGTGRPGRLRGVEGGARGDDPCRWRGISRAWESGS